MINNITDVSNNYSNILNELDALNKAIESNDINNSIKIYNSIRLHATDATLNAIERSEIYYRGLKAHQKIILLQNNTRPNNPNNNTITNQSNNIISNTNTQTIINTNKNKLTNTINDSPKKNIAIGIIFLILCGITIAGVSSPTLIKNITTLFNNEGQIISPNQEIPGTINKTNNTENNNKINNNISNQTNNTTHNTSNNNHTINQSNNSIYINNSNTTYSNSGSSRGGGGGSSGGNDDEPDDPRIDTCTDGIQNENETGIDCGGNCPECPKYIIQNNTGYAEIIISPTAPNMVKIAAEELQTYIYKMTNITLPINTTKNESIKYQIYVGQSNYTDEIGITDEECEYDSFKMISGENYLVLLGKDTPYYVRAPFNNYSNGYIPTLRSLWDNITGHYWENPYIIHYKNYDPDLKIWEGDGRGTINAVYEFLYSQGIRWYYPGEIGEIVPHKEEILLPYVNTHIRPDFALRHIFFYYKQFISASEDNLKWQLRLRLNSGEEYLGPTRGHGTNLVTSRAEVRSSRPEFYAIWNGVLMNDTDQKQNLCSTELVEENAEYIRTVFSYYDVPLENICPADGYTRVSETSQECIDKATPERGYDGRLSDYVWSYINDVALKVYETHPDKKVSGLAYTTYKLPPLTIEELSPNLVVGLARHTSDFSDDSYKEFYRNLTLSWLEKIPTKEVFVWDYYLHNIPTRDSGKMLVYFPHVLADEIKFLKGKSKGTFVEVSTNYEGWNLSYDSMAATSLNVYIFSRLHWNSSQDVDDLLDEYYELYYGPASENIKELVEYSENNINTYLTTPSVLINMRNMAREAKIVAGDTIYGERIEILLKFLNSTYIGEEANISMCQNLTSPSTTYRLTTNLDSKETCFNILDDNITLDCQGHSITYDFEEGTNEIGIYSSYDYTVVKNCRLIGQSINLDSGINGLVENNTVLNFSSVGIKVHDTYEITNSLNNRIINNIAESATGTGIYASNTINTTLINNSGISTSNIGIYIFKSPNSTLINNTGTSSTETGIRLYLTNNSILTNNTGVSNSSRAFWLYISSNNNLTSNTGISQQSDGLSLYSYSSNNVLINNTGTSDSGVGINLIPDNSINNTLIGNIGQSRTNRGIYLDFSQNNILISNTGISNSSYGIYLRNSSNNILTNNIARSNFTYGIYISTRSTNNTLTNNTAIGIAGILVENSNINRFVNNIGEGSTGTGLTISGSRDNTFINNTGTSNTSQGIYLYNSNNNNFTNQIAIGYDVESRGIYLLQTNNTLFENCINITGYAYDLYTITSSTNNTFINCSYNTSKELISESSNMIRQWYYDASIINNIGTPISNANVSIYNSSGTIIHSALTNTNGRINKKAITEYTNTGGVRRYSTPHTVNVTKTGYTTNSTIYNITITNNILSSITLI